MNFFKINLSFVLNFKKLCITKYFSNSNKIQIISKNIGIWLFLPRPWSLREERKVDIFLIVYSSFLESFGQILLNLEFICVIDTVLSYLGN